MSRANPTTTAQSLPLRLPLVEAALAKIAALPLVGPAVLLTPDERVQLHRFATQGGQAATERSEATPGQYGWVQPPSTTLTGHDSALMYLAWHRLGERHLPPAEFVRLVRGAGTGKARRLRPPPPGPSPGLAPSYRIFIFIRPPLGGPEFSLHSSTEEVQSWPSPLT